MHGADNTATDSIYLDMLQLNLINIQQDATYSVYYISVGSSTCFGCWHLSSALVVELELIHVYRMPTEI